MPNWWDTKKDFSEGAEQMGDVFVVPDDVDLGGDVSIRWVFAGQDVEREICGGILKHPKAGAPDGFCEGAFWLAGSKFIDGTKRPVWYWKDYLSGQDEPVDFAVPSLSPSFRCHCNYHGWIHKGKWVYADG